MSSLFRPIGKIVAGGGVAQLLSFAALPALSRLYSPQEFGLFSSVLVPVGLMAILACVQLQHAIVLPRVNSHALGLFQIGCAGALGAGAFTIALASCYVFLIESSPTIDWDVVMLAGLAVTATAVSQLVQGLAVRSERFGSISMAAIGRVIGSVTLQFILGLLGVGAAGLLAGYVFGEIMGAAIVMLRLRSELQCISVMQPLLRYRALIVRYRDFVIHGSAQELLNSASQGVPVILLTYYFNAASAGAYAFAMRLLLAPAQLVGNAVRQVLYRDLSSSVHMPSRNLTVFDRATLILAVPGFVVAAVAAPFLPSAFAIIFGDQWVLAGEYASWLFFWVVFLLCNVPATLAFRTLRRQEVSLRFNVGILALRVIVLCIGGLYLSDNVTIAVFAFAGTVINIMYILFARHLIINEARGTHP